MEYKEKKITAIIDLKSSGNFYPNYELQVYVARKLWQQEFPTVKIDKVFNYGVNTFEMKTLYKYIRGGKTGRFKPYKLKDQTDSFEVRRWKKYLSLYHEDPKNLKNVGISLEVNEDFELSLEADIKDSIVVSNDIEDLSNEELF
jgi:hypothetical protein